MKTRSEETVFADQFVPYYYQIADLLRRQIAQGDLAPGAKLPQELDLAKNFGVSRGPIRQALSLLEADGLITRHRGRGTFVSDNIKRPKSLNLTGMIEEYATHGMEGVFHLHSVEEISPSPKVANFFELSSEDRISRIERVRLIDKTPFCYILNYVPIQIGRKIPRTDYKKWTLFKIFEKRLHIPFTEMRQTIEAKSADNKLASRLSIGIMEPIMYVETFALGEKSVPLEFSQIFYRGDRFKYTVEQIRGLKSSPSDNTESPEKTEQ